MISSWPDASWRQPIQPQESDKQWQTHLWSESASNVLEDFINFTCINTTIHQPEWACNSAISYQSFKPTLASAKTMPRVMCLDLNMANPTLGFKHLTWQHWECSTCNKGILEWCWWVSLLDIQIFIVFYRLPIAPPAFMLTLGQGCLLKCGRICWLCLWATGEDSQEYTGPVVGMAVGPNLGRL